uniref:Uncharacterized protein n=1 Tax=Pyramimonas obovata TaxID=1411642 RepID=A0A7S0R2I2_9CHLO|mmetsp:Transcript_2404/g.4914  ORF Transcript_2404/g.4914 Transcript_2404/m.4914 type:complete len:444 (+) Transcript_2404:233-1564(+)|eukprot:CAMPEP_0118939210 /NCGR_PEP_ID=MMETSP1169-20130426/28278_1 /TAXON_ID=36882 /ORGANISM="Pyramimonas obovata, Strain CCMP722" /LENGTH=443 /DNA_ID=CAMNT_0006883415 /DNA_START=160 /DNA_END=1491 /DNA_ORIENTATION=+
MLHLPSLELKFDVADRSKPANSKKAPTNGARPVASRGSKAEGSVVQPKDLKSHLESWDKCGRTTRLRILEAFVSHNKDKTCLQLEHEYGHVAGLFLARVLAWLRSLYPLGQACTNQLEVIYIFLSASGNNSFLAQFTQAGGVGITLDMLCIDTLSARDQANAAKILYRVACAWPSCEGDLLTSRSVATVIQHAVQQPPSRAQESCTQLLHHLALSRSATLVLLQALLPLLAREESHACLLASRVLRVALSLEGAQLANAEVALVAECAVARLGSPHQEVQEECSELLLALCALEGGNYVVATRLLGTFAPASANHLADLTAHVMDLLFDKAGLSLKPSGCDALPEHRRRCLGAKLLAQLAADFSADPLTRDVVARESAVLGLLRLMADTEVRAARANGLAALLALLDHAPEVKEIVRHQLGDLFLGELTSRRANFFGAPALAE